MNADAPLPDRRGWDGRADAETVRRWLEQFRQRPDDPAFAVLKDLWDERAAPVLRSYLDDPDERVADFAIYAIGGCGSVAEDGPRLVRMALASAVPSPSLLSTLTELEVPGTVDLLRSLVDRAAPGGEAEIGLLDRLLWLGDNSIAERLMALARERGLGPLPPLRLSAAEAVMRVGSVQHRRELADLAVEVGRRLLRVKPVDRDSRQTYFSLLAQWNAYVVAAHQTRAPELSDVVERVNAAREGLAEDERLAIPGASVLPVEEFANRVVPSVWLRPAEARDRGRVPVAKFLGQPEWRDDPAWPIGGDGEPLMFYGQLPLPGDRVAYVFLCGPEEWQPLGPGNAVVVQPGNLCHLPTERRSQGPQEFGWTAPTGYRGRRRWEAKPERYVELVASSDPVSWDHPLNVPESGWARDDERNWNKIGGTPRWLQSAESPGRGWTYLAQFTADSLASERGDGAECYLWEHRDGAIAFGWQCH